ncbi:MAG: hypothetical protein OEY59_12830 [Deltaproteobacteria bacterium]|nr:hypothetical protein [Deltaproteobacteria bacterium]
MKDRSVISLNVILIIGVSLILGWAGGCGSKKVSPLELPITIEDQQKAEFPPAEEELYHRPQMALALLVSGNEAAIPSRTDNLMSFIRESFETNGNFAFIPDDVSAAFFARDENRLLQASNVADAIQVGKALGAEFVFQVQTIVTNAEQIKGADQFKAQLNLTIFTTGSGQLVIEQDVPFNSQDLASSMEKLREMAQTHFPLRGYILETRGGHKVVKISLGRSSGIEIGREFLIRERVVRNELVGGMLRKVISYPSFALAKVEVILVMENDSWALVDKSDRSSVRTGQTVFSLPEKRGLF